MKAILVMVASLDGKTTRGSHPPNSWASKEDHDFFLSLIEKNDLFLMGSQTFLAARKSMKLSPNKLRIVLTRDPQKYREYNVTGQLEFTDQSPRSLLARLRPGGYKQAILLCGETLATVFFKDHLVDEIWVTIEPKLFGSGKSIVSDKSLDVDLKLKSIRLLNSQGTLLIKYVVV